MTILCDNALWEMLNAGLTDNPDTRFVNPASIDIRIGKTMMREAPGRMIEEEIPDSGYFLSPGQFVLVATMESFNVPNGYAMDLRLKSSTARLGFDHSLAFWVDPGWQGVLTMEIRNMRQQCHLRLLPGQRFAQVVVHKLSGLSASPYKGRYHGANKVESSKDGD